MGIKKWRSSGMETIHLGSRNVQGEKGDAKLKWQLFWGKIRREKGKMFSASVALSASYDPDTYSQNFDQGCGWTDQDNLPRSFSARYADPNRILQKKNVRHVKEV